MKRVRQVRAVVPHGIFASGRTVRREQTRATGNGCRRGTNLRRVERWWESCIAPTLSQDSHERSSGNPANPMSGDGMQQARTPAAEKTVEVVHAPQGRNKSPGRHARNRTSHQRWREGEWTREGFPEEGHPTSTREQGRALGSHNPGCKARSQSGASKGTTVRYRPNDSKKIGRHSIR